MKPETRKVYQERISAINKRFAEVADIAQAMENEMTDEQREEKKREQKEQERLKQLENLKMAQDDLLRIE